MLKISLSFRECVSHALRYGVHLVVYELARALFLGSIPHRAIVIMLLNHGRKGVSVDLRLNYLVPHCQIRKGLNWRL